MDDLANYYRKLSAWEDKPPLELIAAWQKEDAEAIVADFRVAISPCDFAVNLLTVPGTASNQSIGNKVAEFFVTAVNRHLRSFKIENCSGPGYPDKFLRRLHDGRLFVFELKATSEFDRNDSNRIVLTSSSQKLRRYFPAPINHLLATACYQLEDTQIEIQNLRLDFLEPTTPVNMRLEASVSQRLLARGTHMNFTL